MIEFYSSFNFNSIQWIQVAFCAIGIGMAKTGLGGIGLLVVPIMASLFGVKSSTGVLLILLILADFLGVGFYHRHANINILIKLYFVYMLFRIFRNLIQCNLIAFK